MNSLEVNASALNSLLESFYTLTKIKIVIYNEDFKKILSYPEGDSPFCEYMQNYYFGTDKCNNCAKDFCEHCKETNDIYINFCHSGLTEVVLPIINENVLLGYIMFGQTTHLADRNILENKVKDSCSLSHLPLKIKKLISAIPLKTKDEIFAAAEILKTIANYIIIKHYITRKNAQIIEQIYNFIDDNIHDRITVDGICKKLLISKTKLYSVIKSEFPKGVNHYIVYKKMKVSKEMLLNTNKTIDEIAKEFSVKNGNYYSKCFKRVYGVSPKTFIKNNKKTSPSL